MRAVIQRVSQASVTIEGIKKSEIAQGFLILLGICNEDTMEDVDWLVKKTANLIGKAKAEIVYNYFKERTK